MKTAQKPGQSNLGTLMAWLREGRFVIPNFQRQFEWMPWDIRDLVRSIFLDYYIGSLLLWKGKRDTFEGLSASGLYGYDRLPFTDEGRRANPEWIVLDGQQRLTAMQYAFLAPDIEAPNRSGRAFYYVLVDRLMNGEHDDAFTYFWDSKAQRALQDDREQQFEQHLFPCALIGSPDFYALPGWLQGYRDYWSRRAVDAKEAGDAEALAVAGEHAENAASFASLVVDMIQQYQISHIELDEELGIDKVCDVFTQLNSKGVRLDVFDLMNALLTPKDLELKQMWLKAAPRLDYVKTAKMNVYILQVMSILRQAYCSPKYLYFLMPGQERPIRDPDGTRRKEVLVHTVDEFRARWDQAVNALEQGMHLLRDPREYGAISPKYLPYAAIIPAFSALQAFVRERPADERLAAQQKVRLWYWASVFTNSYSGSVESTTARDYQDVTAWIRGEAGEPRLIEQFRRDFRGLDLQRETNSSSSIYNGIFDLVVLAGARDWVSGHAPRHDDLDDHHIVPKSWAETAQLDAGSINTILNRTPLTSEANRHVIGDKLPNVYLPEMIRNNGEETVLAIMRSHLISPAAVQILLRPEFGPQDFCEFIQERRQTVFDAIEHIAFGRVDPLPPSLHKLNARIETIELALRRAIVDALAGNPSLLPEHVKEKVRQRVAPLPGKEPGSDEDRYHTLPGMLEYSDLRELEDTIFSKPHWPAFQGRLGNRELLKMRFQQLADLRNAIRHSRTVTEVTVKDGEAAIVWFEQAMKLKPKPA